MKTIPKLTRALALLGSLYLGSAHAAAQTPDSRDGSRLRERLSPQEMILDTEGQIVGLRLPQFSEFSEFGELAPLVNMESLEIDYSGEVSDGSLNGIGRLTRLKSLHLRYADELSRDSLSVLKFLPQLTQLELTHADQIDDVSSLADCVRLKRLKLEAVPVKWELLLASKRQADMPIEALEISGDGNYLYRDLEVIATFPKLRQIIFEEVESLNDDALQALSKCSTLKSIQIKNCNQVTGDFLKTLTPLSLDELHIVSTTFRLESLGELAGRMSLRSLTLKTGFVGRKPNPSNSDDTPFAWLRDLSGLEELEVDSRQFSVAELLALKSASHLKTLNIAFPRNTEVNEDLTTALANWTALVNVRLAGIKMVPKSLTDFLGQAPQLEEAIFEKASFQDLEGLFESKRLQRLGLLSCSLKDSDLQRISELPELVTLDLLGNSQLTDQTLKRLANCRKLERLRLSACRDMIGEGFAEFSADAPLKTAVLLRLSKFQPSGLEHLFRLNQLEEVAFQSSTMTDEHFEKLHLATRIPTVLMEPGETIDEIFRWQLLEFRPDLTSGTQSIDWASYFHLRRPYHPDE